MVFGISKWSNKSKCLQSIKTNSKDPKLRYHDSHDTGSTQINHTPVIVWDPTLSTMYNWFLTCKHAQITSSDMGMGQDLIYHWKKLSFFGMNLHKYRPNPSEFTLPLGVPRVFVKGSAPWAPRDQSWKRPGSARDLRALPGDSVEKIGDIPIYGWFISWKLLWKWMIYDDLGGGIMGVPPWLRKPPFDDLMIWCSWWWWWKWWSCWKQQRSW